MASPGHATPSAASRTTITELAKNFSTSMTALLDALRHNDTQRITELQKHIDNLEARVKELEQSSSAGAHLTNSTHQNKDDEVENESEFSQMDIEEMEETSPYFQRQANPVTEKKKAGTKGTKLINNRLLPDNNEVSPNSEWRIPKTYRFIIQQHVTPKSEGELPEEVQKASQDLSVDRVVEPSPSPLTQQPGTPNLSPLPPMQKELYRNDWNQYGKPHGISLDKFARKRRRENPLPPRKRGQTAESNDDDNFQRKKVPRGRGTKGASRSKQVSPVSRIEKAPVTPMVEKTDTDRNSEMGPMQRPPASPSSALNKGQTARELLATFVAQRKK